MGLSPRAQTCAATRGEAPSPEEAASSAGLGPCAAACAPPALARASTPDALRDCRSPPRQVWSQLDPRASGYIRAADLPVLIMELEPPLGNRGTASMRAGAQDIIMTCDIPNRRNRFHFTEVRAPPRRARVSPVPFRSCCLPARPAPSHGAAPHQQRSPHPPVPPVPQLHAIPTIRVLRTPAAARRCSTRCRVAWWARSCPT